MALNFRLFWYIAYIFGVMWVEIGTNITLSEKHYFKLNKIGGDYI